MLAASSGARDDFIVGATHISKEKELIVGGVLENDVSGLASRRAELHAYSI